MKVIQLIKDKAGELKQVSQRVYFPRSEFHTRFDSLFSMEEQAQWGTYHRSRFKKIEGAKNTQYTFHGNQDSEKPVVAPKTGTFYSPFHFKSYKTALRPIKKAVSVSESGVWYDRLLMRQKRMAAYVVKKVKERNPGFLINSDNHYPCVLFSLPKPEAEKNPKVWSQLLSAYLIALTNTLAYERGINIEMVRRSSFGSLRPSIAECGDSVRVSLGLTPKPYADCVIEAIFYIEKIFENSKSFESAFKSGKLEKTLEKYNEANSTKKKAVNIALEETLWDTLWAPGDSSNRSFASQFFRKSVVEEYLVDSIQTACLKMPLEKLFDKKNKKAQHEAFVRPLENILNLIRLKGKSLSIKCDTDKLTDYQWKEAKPVEEDEFWALAEDMAKHLGAPKKEIQSLINAQITEDFHSYFEGWAANFNFQPVIDDSVEDGYGSDSEAEDELCINGKAQTIHAKKMITATGMRAIQLIHAVSRQYLHDTYKLDTTFLTFTASQMYYETEDALKKHPIPMKNVYEKKKKGVQTNMCFFDVNHCNTTHEEMCDEIAFIDKKDCICAIDITSATTGEIHDILVRLFSQRSKLEVVLMISSGLKNEQAMSDYNPYGTVRIFSRNSHSLNSIYSDLIDLEEKAKYLHPKESHLIRKTAKQAGMTPTNASILRCGKEKSPDKLDVNSL